MKNITSKTTFTAIAALFFATSLYATDMKSNEMSMAKDSMPRKCNTFFLKEKLRSI